MTGGAQAPLRIVEDIGHGMAGLIAGRMGPLIAVRVGLSERRLGED
jgi:hypothetical protein